jgi:hypothetical protein
LAGTDLNAPDSGQRHIIGEVARAARARRFFFGVDDARLGRRGLERASISGGAPFPDTTSQPREVDAQRKDGSLFPIVLLINTITAADGKRARAPAAAGALTVMT